MSVAGRVTIASLRSKKIRNEAITMLTAYDFPMARLLHRAGIDIILVSDALGTVGLGRPEAVSVTVDEMIYHTQACRNGAGTCMVVTTMPFGSYNNGIEAVSNATRIMKEGKADAVHLEGTYEDAPTIKAIIQSGIPVMGHIGIIKQKIVRSGVFRIQGRTASEAVEVVKDALNMVQAGVFALVLECVPSPLAEAITRAVEVPTIGIGAGSACDGQGLVSQDMLGLYKELSPRFLKVYADLETVILKAVSAFHQDVQHGIFPGPEHAYSISEEELTQLVDVLQDGVRADKL